MSHMMGGWEKYFPRRVIWMIRMGDEVQELRSEKKHRKQRHRLRQGTRERQSKFPFFLKRDLSSVSK